MSNQVVDYMGQFVSTAAELSYIDDFIAGPVSAVNEWTVYNDGLVDKPVDGQGGAVNITLTRNSTDPISSTADFLITKDGADRQGQGVSYDFNIDKRHLARPLQVTIDYKIRTGTYPSNLHLYVIDTTSNEVIQLSSFIVENLDSSLTGRIIGTFQTHVTNQSYRLCLHIADGDTGAYTLSFNNVRVWEPEFSYSSNITNPVSYTLDITAATTNPTKGTFEEKAHYWFEGGFCHVKIDFNHTAGGSNGVGQYFFSLPFPVDPNYQITDGTGKNKLGEVALLAGGTVAYRGYALTVSGDDSKFSIVVGNSTSTDQYIGSSYCSLGLLAFSTHLKYKVAGKASTLTTTAGDTQRPVAWRAVVANPTLTANVTDMTFNTADIDTHGKGDSTGWTCPKTGLYKVGISGIHAQSYTGTWEATPFFAGGASSPISRVGSNVDLRHYGELLFSITKGTKVTFRSNISLTVGNNTGFAYIYEFAPNRPASYINEEISCRYETTAGDNFPVSGTWYTIGFGTRHYDSHLILNGSGVATIPVSGRYRIMGKCQWNPNTTGERRMRISINSGSSFSYGPSLLASATRSDGIGWAEVTDTLDLLKGDTIEVQATQLSGGALALITTAGHNILTIARIQ
jgi:hypothetical protein